MSKDKRTQLRDGESPYFMVIYTGPTRKMIDTKKNYRSRQNAISKARTAFVVECTCTPGNEIELTIDSDTSVGIDACAELSRAIEAEFDRDAEDFR